MNNESDDVLYGPAMTPAEARKTRQQAMETAQALAASAVDYQSTQHERGFQCSASEAVARVAGGGSSGGAASLSSVAALPVRSEEPRYAVAALGPAGDMRSLSTWWKPGDSIVGL